MPNIMEGDGRHGLSPDDDKIEGPFFFTDARQLRAIADFVGDHPNSVKIEYRGAGYWRVYLLNAEGEPTAEKLIFAH